MLNPFLNITIALFPPTVAYVLPSAFFGEGSGVIHMDNVGCTGHEQRLVDCRYTDPNYDHHSEDVGVRCIPRKCKLGLLPL